MQSGPAIQIKAFEALTLSELHACLKLRGEVFVVGQGICSVADVDDYDPLCCHAMLRINGALVGTARLLPMDGGATIKVGRVAVDAGYRGRGLGTALMRHVQGWIAREPGRAGLIHAQAYLEPWYGALGWQREGAGFQEAGIEHVTMRYMPFGVPQGPLH